MLLRSLENYSSRLLKESYIKKVAFFQLQVRIYIIKGVASLWVSSMLIKRFSLLIFMFE